MSEQRDKEKASRVLQKLLEDHLKLTEEVEKLRRQTSGAGCYTRALIIVIASVIATFACSIIVQAVIRSLVSNRILIPYSLF